MAIRDGLARCSACGSKDTHRCLPGSEIMVPPRFGKITNSGVTEWLCWACGHEDTDETIIREAEDE